MTWILRRARARGSVHPIDGRLLGTIIECRQFAIGTDDSDPPTHMKRMAFDRLFVPAYRTLQTVSFAGDAICRGIRSMPQGEVSANADTGHATIRIDGRTEDDLDDLMLQVVCGSRIVLARVDKLLKHLGLNIGFLFQESRDFESGLRVIDSKGHTSLAAYLKACRTTWSQPLVKLRNDLEHHGWVVPEFSHDSVGGHHVVRQPSICGVPLHDYIHMAVNWLASFVESVVCYAFDNAIRLDSGGSTYLTEIPMSEQRPERPLRFALGIAALGHAPWEIAFSEERCFSGCSLAGD